MGFFSFITDEAKTFASHVADDATSGAAYGPLGVPTAVAADMLGLSTSDAAPDASGYLIDPWPPSARPDWLKPYAHVQGEIRSAPLDMPSRLDSVVNALKAAGWLVVVRSVGTDFSNPLGVPVPKTQPIDVLLHRTDHPYTASDAESALSDAIGSVSMGYSAVGRWASEVDANVIQPTVDTVTSGLKSALPLVIGLAVVVLIVKLK